MKKIVLLLICFSLSLVSWGQVSKTINVITAGTLSTLLTTTELNTVTNLTITGTIDARDFLTMRAKMPVLSVINLSSATIAEYSGYYGCVTNSNISSYITYKANEIPQQAFIDMWNHKGKTTLTSIILPNNITGIGESAFVLAENLTSITIPASVKSIGNSCFTQCNALTSFNIPSTVTSLGISMFNSCENLSSVTLPNTLTELPSGLFNSCTSLKTINIPSTVTKLGSSLFQSSGITSVVLPPNITEISSALFNQCKNLTSIDIPSKVTTIGSNAFSGCTKITSLIIPNSVKSLEGNCFVGDSGLVSITIPASVNYMGVANFPDCTNLETVNWLSVVDNIPSGNFLNCTKLRTINIPSTIKTINTTAFGNCSALKSIYIPSSVTLISATAFYKDSTFVTIDKSNMNYMSEDGLIYNKQKTELIYCPTSKKGSLALPIGLKSLEYMSCVDLKINSLYIPNTVNSIGNTAFYGSKEIQKVYCNIAKPLDINPPLFGPIDFNKCILYVPIGAKGAYLSSTDWDDFVNVEEIDFNDSLSINISAGTLNSVLNEQQKIIISSLKISGSIDVRDIVFIRDSLPSLKTLDLSDANIENYTGSINNLLRSASTTTIFDANTLPTSSFKGKTRLTNLTLPKTLISIQPKALYGCSSLQKLTTYKQIPIVLSTQDSIFYKVETTSCKLNVPSTASNLYRSATVWSDFTTMTSFDLTTQGVHATSDTIRLSVYDDNLFIYGIEVGEQVTVYNLKGEQVLNQIARDKSCSIKLARRGIYIVLINNKAYKIIY